MIHHSCNEWSPSISAADAAVLIAEELPDSGISPESLVYCSWPRLFGSTAGPFGGIGGHAMTLFRMEAWVNAQGYGIAFCDGHKVAVGHIKVEVEVLTNLVTETTE